MVSERKKQVASEGNWLCTDITSDDCLFAHVVLLDENAPLWNECTNAEKEQWEAEHTPEEPIV